MKRLWRFAVASLHLQTNGQKLIEHERFAYGLLWTVLASRRLFGSPPARSGF